MLTGVQLLKKCPKEAGTTWGTHLGVGPKCHLWDHGAELCVAKGADGREHSRGRPHRQGHSDGARVVEDAGRRDEDARADDDAHDDADAVQQTQLPLLVWMGRRDSDRK